MSNNFTSNVQSPAPTWTTLKGRSPTDPHVETNEGPPPKKRKNGDGRDVLIREEPRLSVKRPRHTVSGPEIRDPSGSSKSDQTSLGVSGHDSVPKPSTGPTRPNIRRSITGYAKKQTGSTASNLAALYQSSASQSRNQQLGIDPFILRWRKQNQARIIQPAREETRRALDSETNQQTKKSINSQANRIGNSNSSASGSSSRPAVLADKTQALSGHSPVRQLARKTGASGPPKNFVFNRQVTSSSDASDESPSAESGSSLVSSSVNTVPLRPLSKPRKFARKTMDTQRAVKEQQATTSKLQNSNPDVTFIEISSDESVAEKATRKPRANQDQAMSGVSKRIEGAKGKEVHKKSKTSHDLPTVINRAYKPPVKEKKLPSDIIDLTVDDSDDPDSNGVAAPQRNLTPLRRPKSEVATPGLHDSPPKMPLADQGPGSSPSKLPIFPSTPMKGHPRRVSMAAVPSSQPLDEPGPRSRSVPASTGPDLSMAAETSSLAASPRSTPSHEESPVAFARPSRIKRVICSPNVVSDGSDGSEEREVHEAVLHDTGLSSNEAHDMDEDETLIPAMRTNTSSLDLIPPPRRLVRASSSSSPSEMDNLAPYTDAESPPDSSPSPGLEESPVGLTYGGFKALTWENHKKDYKNLGLTHYSAKDLPTALPDSINRLSEYTRLNPGIRDIFRAYMLENIMEDESNAPDIEIINNIDHQPTPLFEFVYSNRIWYGEGVPLPDYSKLKGCGCVGKCDPKSKTCLCAQRQGSYYLDTQEGFVYDKFGRLKYPGYPIFECNELCSCDDECRNRVVQHGRKHQVSLTKTEEKGWGVFNGSKRIPHGSFIGIYAGELLTDDQSEHRGLYYDKIGKTYLFDVDFWHLKTKSNPDSWHNKYTMDAFHAGNFTRFLNHSCDPNARLFPCYINEPDIEKPLLVVFSIRDIEPYEEICFNYKGRYQGEDDDEVEDELEKRMEPVYATCRCGAKNCTGKFF